MIDRVSLGGDFVRERQEWLDMLVEVHRMMANNLSSDKFMAQTSSDADVGAATERESAMRKESQHLDAN